MFFMFKHTIFEAVNIQVQGIKNLQNCFHTYPVQSTLKRRSKFVYGISMVSYLNSLRIYSFSIALFLFYLQFLPFCKDGMKLKIVQ